MISKRIIYIAMAVFIALLAGACAKDEHWGQRFDEKGKWWKQEGQSWDRKDNVFMAVGCSNPDWKDDFDKKHSADLDARAQVAAFMQSLVDNYMRETRSRNYSISESVIESSANESVLGSVVVERKKKQKRYFSLVKVDLNYFFKNIYDDFARNESAKVRKTSRGLTEAELDKKIGEATQNAIADLKKLEAPAVEKSMNAAGGPNEKGQ